MSLMTRLLGRGRVRSAKRKLTRNPTAASYVELAREFTRVGNMAQVVSICAEGLEQFPGNLELFRLNGRALDLMREERLRELYREVRESPRPAVWREMCETLLAAGRVDRAEETADQWLQASKDGEARLFRARARIERFLTDRRREDGEIAFRYVEEAEKALPRDPRPLRLHLNLTSRVGVWLEARKVAARLLELDPGDPTLEGRFRTLMSLSDESPSIDHALREVERTGLLADDDPDAEATAPDTRALRPLLQEMVNSDDVGAAVYVRGGTALVQGPKGATAERTARAVREVITRTRGHARRLGLGQPQEIRVEGSFGTLLISPGDFGAGALWCTKKVRTRHQEALRHLIGVDRRRTEASS